MTDIFSPLGVAELVVDSHADARLDRRHAVVEIVHVEFEELAVGDLGLFDAGSVAGEIGHHAHHEGQLDEPLGVVGIFVGDVDARSAIAANELLSAVGRHGHPSRPAKPGSSAFVRTKSMSP